MCIAKFKVKKKTSLFKFTNQVSFFFQGYGNHSTKTDECSETGILHFPTTVPPK